MGVWNRGMIVSLAGLARLPVGRGAVVGHGGLRWHQVPRSTMLCRHQPVFASDESVERPDEPLLQNDRADEPLLPAEDDRPDEEPVLPVEEDPLLPDEWGGLTLSRRYPLLRDISVSIRVRRTVEEAELALKLEGEFNPDPSILQDIDFAALCWRLNDELAAAAALPTNVLSADEASKLNRRNREAQRALAEVVPKYLNVTTSGAVAEAVPKLRRVIERARELPLTVELPAPAAVFEGVDLQLALQESTNLAVGVRRVWQRLNGVSPDKEEELAALQKESAALLSLRAEATKLRGGIRLVQRQKEMKTRYIIRSDSDALLEETLRADISIAKLQTELSLKAARLELERIFITLESELTSNSALVDQLLPSVEQYGSIEDRLVDMVEVVLEGRHTAVERAELEGLERDIGQQLLLLGLQDDNAPKTFSFERARESVAINLSRLGVGIRFYWRGLLLLGEDLQLMINMLTRAIVKGYTLRTREVKLLRRIAKDLLTFVPFVIILLIPLTPLGHVLIFSLIQRLFPDFFPSQFTESRQNIMSMYSSITTPSESRSAATPPLGEADSPDADSAEPSTLP